VIAKNNVPDPGAPRNPAVRSSRSESWQAKETRIMGLSLMTAVGVIAAPANREVAPNPHFVANTAADLARRSKIARFSCSRFLGANRLTGQQAPRSARPKKCDHVLRLCESATSVAPVSSEAGREGLCLLARRIGRSMVVRSVARTWLTLLNKQRHVEGLR